MDLNDDNNFKIDDIKVNDGNRDSNQNNSLNINEKSSDVQKFEDEISNYKQNNSIPKSTPKKSHGGSLAILIILLLVVAFVVYYFIFSNNSLLKSNINNMFNNDNNGTINKNVNSNLSNKDLNNNSNITNKTYNLSNVKFNNFLKAIDNNCNDANIRIQTDANIVVPFLGEATSYDDIGIYIQGQDQNNSNNCKLNLIYYSTKIKFLPSTIADLKSMSPDINDEAIKEMEKESELKDPNGIMNLTCYFNKNNLKDIIKEQDTNSSSFLTYLSSSNSNSDVSIDTDQSVVNSTMDGNGFVCYQNDTYQNKDSN